MTQTATKHSFLFEPSATIVMSEVENDWNINLQHLEAPKPGSNSLRAELARKKEEIMQQFPKTESAPRATNASSPIVGNNFEGNTFQGIPNDNDMAISRWNKVVSVTNRRIHIYDGETGEELVARSLANLANPLQIAGSKYDPKVIYDPNNDRFVMIFLNGFTWETSQIIIAFSQTADPTGEWNLYALPGNPLDNETWSDYPVVGISGKDLYIGVNTFLNGSENNSGYVETCLWQIGLKEGYIGFELVTNYYSDIAPNNLNLFNICPIPAAAESDAEDMYLLSNRATASQSNDFYLLHVTGRSSDPDAELELIALDSDQPYRIPVPADQPGAHFFDTNDSRVLGGYLLNGRIYFVQACTDPSNGRAAIYHGVINDVSGSPTMVSRIYSESNMDYGFPNISWTGTTADDEQSIISFNHSSNSEFGGFSAMFVDADLNASDRVEIKQGLSTVNLLQDEVERWGDYTGSQRMYNEPGTVWAVGSYGNANGGHGTWISKLTSPTAVTGLSSQPIVISNSVHPNPFIADLSIDFELPSTEMVRIELVDQNGKLVKLLLEDRMKAGEKRISFNDGLLSSGTYYLVATNSKQRLFSRKVVKQ